MKSPQQLWERQQEKMVFVAGLLSGFLALVFSVIVTYLESFNSLVWTLVAGSICAFLAAFLVHRKRGQSAALLLVSTLLVTICIVPWVETGNGLFDGSVMFAVLTPGVAILVYGRGLALLMASIHFINIVALRIGKPLPVMPEEALVTFELATGVLVLISVTMLMWLFEETVRRTNSRLEEVLLEQKAVNEKLRIGNERLRQAQEEIDAEGVVRRQVARLLAKSSKGQAVAIANTRIGAEDMSAINHDTTERVREVQASTLRGVEQITGLKDLSEKNVRDIEALLHVSDTASNSVMSIVDAQQQMSFRVEELVKDSGAATMAMDGMKVSIADIERNARGAESLAQRVIENAKRGEHEMVRVLDGMGAIEANSEAVSETIGDLGLMIESIDQILLVIGDVADETQLLSLNASIIATQAGEEGRAFSVVAGEIKKLAQRTMKSTGAIQDLVSAVQAKSRAAVAGMSENQRAVREGGQRSVQTSKSFEDIVVSAQEATETVSAIVTSTQQQLLESEQVYVAAERVGENTRSIREQVQEQSKKSDEMHNLSIAIRQAAKAAEQKATSQEHSAAQLQDEMDRIRGAVDQIAERHEDHVIAVTQILEALRTIEESQGVQSSSVERLSLESGGDG